VANVTTAKLSDVSIMTDIPSTRLQVTISAEMRLEFTSTVEPGALVVMD